MSEDLYDDEAENTGHSGLRHPMAARFRGYLPVVVDVETGGFNCATDALLEIAATTIGMDEGGFLYPEHTYFFRVEPALNNTVLGGRLPAGRQEAPRKKINPENAIVIN